MALTQKTGVDELPSGTPMLLMGAFASENASLPLDDSANVVNQALSMIVLSWFMGRTRIAAESPRAIVVGQPVTKMRPGPVSMISVSGPKPGAVPIRVSRPATVPAPIVRPFCVAPAGITSEELLPATAGLLCVKVTDSALGSGAGIFTFIPVPWLKPNRRRETGPDP